MKPYVICHMIASIDGRAILSRWRPAKAVPDGLYDSLHEQLAGDAWIVGRATGQEYAKKTGYSSARSGETYPREAWFAGPRPDVYGIVLDPHGKIAWGRGDIGGDPIVVVLTEKVADAHLRGLREDGVSYIFAGEDELDLAKTLRILKEELGIERLLLEGGGIVNGSFVRAGLVDEISLAIAPAIDGAKGAVSIFDSADHESGMPVPVRAMTLRSSETLDGGVVWLRYLVEAKQDGLQRTEGAASRKPWKKPVIKEILN